METVFNVGDTFNITHGERKFLNKDVKAIFLLDGIICYVFDTELNTWSLSDFEKGSIFKLIDISPNFTFSDVMYYYWESQLLVADGGILITPIPQTPETTILRKIKREIGL